MEILSSAKKWKFSAQLNSKMELLHSEILNFPSTMENQLLHDFAFQIKQFCAAALKLKLYVNSAIAEAWMD